MFFMYMVIIFGQAALPFRMDKIVQLVVLQAQELLRQLLMDRCVTEEYLLPQVQSIWLCR